MSPEKLVRMANQIALALEPRGHAEAVTSVAQHINDFWEPRMRKQFFQLLDQGNAGFRPVVLEAAPAIRRPAEAA
ncbi:formate dehydrogenase subunit delta [Neotabrizicola shimadae]|jgi:formate dehydrogenase subunit delta|uniref:Formate dehydrogenase subunit delta n=1 Tax=Neotabrizicola shimadae TaxID=2807096 RepID=A0A8G0ZRV3_9RHOB|nr:formate dehydrogenase subunit delta [Neotabrizicola shimadae]QYZ70276.1 formate dehydrogenase subunit delta [Neotabrizicola shimadae]